MNKAHKIKIGACLKASLRSMQAQGTSGRWQSRTTRCKQDTMISGAKKIWNAYEKIILRRSSMGPYTAMHKFELLTCNNGWMTQILRFSEKSKSMNLLCVLVTLV